ncbi:MAG: hypothetical protein AB1742_06845 [bacterium]
MRMLSYLFLFLGLIAFVAAICLKFDLISLPSYPETFIHISTLGVLIAIAFGVLSLEKK